MGGTERYVNAREAAEECGVTERTVRQWVKDRKVPARKVGAAFRIPLSALEPFRRDAEGPDRQETEVAEAAEPSAAEGGSAGRNEAEAHGLVEALALIARQQDQLLQLAGQVGYLQRQVQEQTARLLALEAPKAEPESADAAQRAQDAILTATGAEPTREPSAGRMRPWWRFWR